MHFLIFTKNLSLQLSLITSANSFKSLQTSPLPPPLHLLFQPQPFWLVVCKVIVNVFCNATLLFWRVVCKVNFLEFFVLLARCLWSHCQFFSLSVKSTFFRMPLFHTGARKWQFGIAIRNSDDFVCSPGRNEMSWQWIRNGVSGDLQLKVC